MSYEVLARKWRPQQFDDVVGQEHVTRTLANAIASGRVAHAYLFVGPRGIGKTSIARIFAKALNCEGGPRAEPCDRCDSCREIAGGRSLDVMEIDGASNNSVDQVRDLREAVRFAPARGPFKIYIIDEVHMLSTSAFNALLKTLEEPPAHVKFLFATTEPEKILPTIVSRCQRFDLRRIPVGLIVERLRAIARDEKVRADEDALLAIARGAEGGLRDAESAFDQLIAFKGARIAEEDVLSVFGLMSRAALEAVADGILSGDIPALMAAVGELDAAGKDLQRVAGELLEHFRNLLVLVHVPDGGALADVTESQRETLARQAAGADTGRLLRVAEVLTETGERMRYALSKRALLEIALVRCARAVHTATLDEVLGRLLALERGEAAAPTAGEPTFAQPVAAAAADVPARPRSASPLAKEAPAPKAAAPAKAPQAAKRARSAPAAGTATPADEAAELARLQAAWPQLLGRIGKAALRLRRALADTHPLRVEGNRVVVAFDPEFAAQLEAVDGTRDRKAVDHLISSELRRPVNVAFEAAEPGDGQRAARAAPPPASEERAPRGRDGDAGKRGSGGGTRSRQELVEDAAVRKAMDVFKAKIVDIREM